MTRFLVTPETWFDLPRQAADCAVAGTRLELALVDANGRRPLGEIPLEELQATHHTFCSWRSEFESDLLSGTLRPGAYDRFLRESRGLVREHALAALAGSGGRASVRVFLRFPRLDELPAEPTTALGFFRDFLYVPHSPSLVRWARTGSTSDQLLKGAATRPWLRVVLQKLAIDDDLVGDALIGLRALYADDSVRDELVLAESRLLESCKLDRFKPWASMLGLDRPTRHETGIAVPPRRHPDGSKSPDVTVLVPSYSHEGYIEATLESVFAQTHSSFRVLVVDDCSPDATVERASRTGDARLKIEVNPQRLGLGTSVLRAVDRITTPYVALLNSDDLFHPERLERCVALLESRAHVNLVATGVVPIDAFGCRLTRSNVRLLFDGRNIADWIQWFEGAGLVRDVADLPSSLLEHNFLVTSSNIVCRTEFLRTHVERLDSLEYCLDWQLFLDAAITGGLAYLPDKLVGYRLHPLNTVWFGDDTRIGYKVEVNRVLGAALRRLGSAASSEVNSADAAMLLTRLAARAMKHSHASLFLLYAGEVLGARAFEAAARDVSVRRELEHLLSQTLFSPATEDGPRTQVVAARVLAGTWEEESRLSYSAPEWLIGNVLWNTSGLSRIGVPVRRGLRWFRRRLTKENR